ncbi:MAG: PLP-dependent aminotransferase family protein [Sneathiellaceae bacterium]
MTIWIPDLAGARGPRYVAIADAIAGAIADGSLADGTRLPTHRDLAFRLGCTVGTVSRAYALAERQGLIAGQVGRGTFVTSGRPGLPALAPGADRPELGAAGIVGREAPGGATAPGRIDRFRQDRAAPQPAAGLSALRLPLEGDPILDLSCNLPNVRLARASLGRHLAGFGDDARFTDLLSYPPASGYRAHRAAIARWVARHGVPATHDRVILTAGTQQALAAAVMALLQPGEVLLCEDPAYAGLRHVANLAQVRLHGVALDPGGMRPDDLDRAARQTGARAVVVTPTLQNPSTATMDATRRTEIAACAARHDLIVVEDDVYGELPWERPPALAAIAPERVIYVGSLSKCLAPALRFGWAVTPQHLAVRLAEKVSAMTLNTSPLNAELAQRWIAQDAEAELPALRRDVAMRQRMVRAALGDLDIRGGADALHVLLMLPFGWSEPDFLRAAREAGIRLAGLDAFRLAPDEGRAGVRLSLGAAADLQELMAAVERLANLVRRTRPAAERVI